MLIISYIYRTLYNILTLVINDLCKVFYMLVYDFMYLLDI